MILLLHFSHRIAGNCKLTSKCLETILEEKVSVKIVQNRNLDNRTIESNRNEEQKCLLGSGELGVNFVSGEKFDDLGKTMEFEIGPLKNSSAVDYLDNGTAFKFLKCFFGYFVPAELDVTSNIVVDELEQKFVLSEVGEGPVLGFESAI